MYKETKFQFFSLIYSIIRVEMPYFDPNFSLIALLNIIHMQYNSFKVCNSVFLIFESKIEILFYIYICRVVELLAWLNIRTFCSHSKETPYPWAITPTFLLSPSPRQLLISVLSFLLFNIRLGERVANRKW